MAGQDSRSSRSFEEWMRRVDKRLLHSERRPVITAASDLLGPGFAPTAVELTDWNADEATFNGMWFSVPGALHAPLPTVYFDGITLGNADGWGIQVAYEARQADGDPDSEWEPLEFVRRFYLPLGAATRAYSAWTAVGGGGGGTGPPGPPGADGSAGGLTFTYTGDLAPFTSQPPWYNDTGHALTLHVVRASLAAAGSTSTVLDVTLNGTSLWTSPGNRPTLGSGVATVKATNMDTVSVPSGAALRVAVVTAGDGTTPLVWQMEAS